MSVGRFLLARIQDGGSVCLSCCYALLILSLESDGEVDNFLMSVWKIFVFDVSCFQRSHQLDVTGFN